MLPPPPRSTLFPYTTLFRSISASICRESAFRLFGRLRTIVPDGRFFLITTVMAMANLLVMQDGETEGGRDGETRSEEHTSELQSQSNLVCRLLLEKKKKKRA